MQHCVKDGDADFTQNFLPRDQDCRDYCGTDISVIERTLYRIRVEIGKVSEIWPWKGEKGRERVTGYW